MRPGLVPNPLTICSISEQLGKYFEFFFSKAPNDLNQILGRFTTVRFMVFLKSAHTKYRE